MKGFTVAIGLTLSILLGAPDAQAQTPKTIDTNSYYRLTTSFRGDGESLEGNRADSPVHDGAAFMDKRQNVTGQLWRFVPEGEWYRLKTQFQGNDHCLEGNRADSPVHDGAAFMDTCQNVSGQLWKLVPEGDWFRLKTMFQADGHCLEGNRADSPVHDGAAFMDTCQNVSGQLWKLENAGNAGKAAAFKTLVSGKLQVCLYHGFAPFSVKDDSGWHGWDVDYLKKFADQNGLGFEVVERDFKGIWLEPDKGSCDIAGSGISYTLDRRDAKGSGAWSNTYYQVVRTFLVRTPDFTQLTKVEDLKGKKVIVTKDSTANSDLCYQMNAKGISSCLKADGDHPCASFNGLPEKTRKQDPACVFIEYPRGGDEANAAADVAAGQSPGDKDPGAPFAYGGGYGSVQSLVCSQANQALATVWPHCNVASDSNAYAEPFSFVVSHADTGLLQALNCFIQNDKTYEGTPIPAFSCPNPAGNPHNPCPR